MLGRTSKVRHATVIGAIGATTALAGFGVIGGGNHPERYETWQTVIEPAGSEGVRITETFDQDFGSHDRRGHQRIIPHDFGAPIHVVASSPDAPDALSVVDLGGETRIRIGDPDVTITGQHRYTLAYTLPHARIASGRLAIDVFDGDEFETLTAEVAVRGFRLANPRCFVGAAGSTTACELRQENGVYRATFGKLPPFTGITVEGDVLGTAAIAAVEPPALPERRTENRLPVTLGVAGLGVAGALPVYFRARRKGRNEVYAGGAAEAAYGTLPAPGGGRATTPGTSPPGASPPPSTILVADDALRDLATIEFAPPRGLEPWEGAVLLTERVDDRTVEAWLSGLAGREVIELGERNGELTIGAGPARSAASERDSALIARLQGGRNPYVTGTYDPKFAAAWSEIATMLRSRIAASGWWTHRGPGESRRRKGGSLAKVLAFGAIATVWLANGLPAGLGVLRTSPVALAAGLLVPAVIAWGVYRAMLPARSAQGSALALRTESFRRFLHASEAQHVEWAWSKGLLREYSGWAVALGEADAWRDALAKANVPPPARAAAGPLVVTGHRASISSSRTKPSSSGSSSGRSGGSSGGRVGGGGGGGSRGSW